MGVPAVAGSSWSVERRELSTLNLRQVVIYSSVLLALDHLSQGCRRPGVRSDDLYVVSFLSGLFLRLSLCSGEL